MTAIRLLLARTFGGIVVLTMFALSPGVAQETNGAPEATVDGPTRTAVIEKLLRELNDRYVFPDVAQRMEAAMRERVQRNEYDTVTTAKALAAKLTADLQEVSKDRHLRVTHRPPAAEQPVPARNVSPESGEQEHRAALSRRGDNYGFHRLERLSGNIGYIDLRMFHPPELAREKAAAAMNFVADTDALIIDLRQNGGGSPEMVALVTSYLFGDTPVNLNDFAGRDGQIQRSYWTLREVPGRRYTGKDVYVLTSSTTFSAAEEFAYNLKNLKRATLVGETTGGGAHPFEMIKLERGFEVAIPASRAVNPITKTNWEGTGVKPEVEVAAPMALKTAHADALQRLRQREKDPARADALQRTLQEVQKDA